MSTTEYLLIALGFILGMWAGYQVSKRIWRDEGLIEGYQLARQDFRINNGIGMNDD